MKNTKYYNQFINNNKDLLNLIENKIKQSGFKNLFFMNKISNERITVDINKRNTITIDISKNNITANIKLEENSIAIYWNKEKIKDEKTFFVNPVLIEMWKTEKETEEKRSYIKSKIFLKKEESQIEIRYVSHNTTRYENRYRIMFDSNFNIKETDYSMKSYQDENIEIKFEVLRKIKDMVQIEEVADYLLLGKNISKETEEILSLANDINSNLLKIDGILQINTNSFNEEYLKETENYILKKIKQLIIK